MEKAELDKLKEKILEQVNSLPKEQADTLREKIENMNNAEFEKFLKEFTLPLQECLFCQIAQGKIATIKIYESKNILAILDINPVARGHILVMPKQHYQFLTQTPDALLLEIFSFVRHIIPAVIRTVKSQGVAINILQGKEQAVPHFVINIIPRFEKDNLAFAWKRLKLSRDELEKIATEIKKEASSMAKQIAQTTKEKESENEEKMEGGEERETSHAEISEEELEKFFKGRIPD